MSCFICAKKYNWRKKEFECRQCKRSVCKDCLVNKGADMKGGTFLCNKCPAKVQYSKVSSSKDLPPAYDHPSTYLGPSMKDIVKPVSKKPVVSTVVSHEDPDAQIRKRLDKLKVSGVVTAESNVDLVNKFQKVTGREAGGGKSIDINRPQQRLTETEEAAKLLEQMSAEVNIDTKYDEFLEENKESNKQKDLDMERRLLILKGIDPDKVKETPVDYSSDDEDTAVGKIINRFAIGPTDPSNFSSCSKEHGDKDDEELPWCAICNEDADYTCHGCDDDLYCKRCFKEFHQDDDDKFHKFSPYKKSKGQ